jgi:ATP-dependent protease ClpP protease subunit
MTALTSLGARCAQAQAFAARARGEAGQRAEASARQWWRVSNADGERAKVYIYDYIDPWGVTAQDFTRELDAITAPVIDLHINSGGGDVWDGYAIWQALKSHPADVTAHIDGIAASAASFIAMSAQEILIGQPARMMIHDAAGLVYGPPADLRMYADLLDSISADVAQIYADKAGGKAADWRESMQANGGWGTWYSSAQAVEAHLADRVDDGTTGTAPAEPAPAEDAPADSTAQQGSATAGEQDARSQLVRAGARLFPPKR